MPHVWGDRWIQNADGTYSRNLSAGAPVAYADQTKAQLEAQLEALGLPRSGTKDELVARLEEHYGSS
jgi:hypothetical protein